MDLELIRSIAKSFVSEFAAMSLIGMIITIPLAFILFRKCPSAAGEINCGIVEPLSILTVSLPAALLGGVIGAITYLGTRDIVLEVVTSVMTAILGYAYLYNTIGKKLKNNALNIELTIQTLNSIGLFGQPKSSEL